MTDLNAIDANHESKDEFQLSELTDWNISVENELIIEELDEDSDSFDIEQSGLCFEQKEW